MTVEHVKEGFLPIPDNLGRRSWEDGTTAILRSMQVGEAITFAKANMAPSIWYVKDRYKLEFKQERLGPKRVRVWRIE